VPAQVTIQLEEHITQLLDESSHLFDMCGISGHAAIGELDPDPDQVMNLHGKQL
jgi:hypothetical protein